jgi:glycosyltransferase involved in cell wall biosynthesis
MHSAVSVPSVSIHILTHNHQVHLSQAIESVLAQDVDFPVEIVVGADTSSDRTLAVAQEYQARFPAIVRVLESTQRRGEVGNFSRTFQACHGRFIALLDGDDYWISSSKLRDQVTFLEAHAGFVLCFHDALTFHEDGSAPPSCYVPGEQQHIRSVEQALAKNDIPTSSVVFRRAPFAELPDWFEWMPWADWPLYILAAQAGHLGYISKVMSAYRIHGDGAWSKLGFAERCRELIHFYEAINAHLNYRYDDLVQAMLAKHACRLVGALAQNGGLDAARSVFHRHLLGRPRRYVPRRTLLKLTVCLYVLPVLRIFSIRRAVAVR